MNCRRKLKAFWQRLLEIQGKALARSQRIEKLGGARDRAGRAVAALVRTTMKAESHLAFNLDRDKMRLACRSEGRYLLRTNRTGPGRGAAVGAIETGTFPAAAPTDHDRSRHCKSAEVVATFAVGGVKNPTKRVRLFCSRTG